MVVAFFNFKPNLFNQFLLRNLVVLIIGLFFAQPTTASFVKIQSYEISEQGVMPELPLSENEEDRDEELQNEFKFVFNDIEIPEYLYINFKIQQKWVINEQKNFPTLRNILGPPPKLYF